MPAITVGVAQILNCNGAQLRTPVGGSASSTVEHNQSVRLRPTGLVRQPAGGRWQFSSQVRLWLPAKTGSVKCLVCQNGSTKSPVRLKLWSKGMQGSPRMFLVLQEGEVDKKFLDIQIKSLV